MYIEQKSKNCFRVEATKNGVRYQVYFDTKPTQRDAYIELAKKIESSECNVSSPLIKCCEVYIASKDNMLKPNTLRTYERYKRTIPENIAKLPLNRLTEIKLQSMINTYAKDRDAKSVKSFYGFIKSVIQKFSKYDFKITLPKPVKKKQYIPTITDVKNILTHTTNPQLQIVFSLASYSLRFGEIKALTMADIHEDYVDVNKTVSYGIGYKKEIVAPKTFDSTRQVQIPPDLYKKIKKEGLKIPSEKYCLKELHAIQEDLGIPKFHIHHFRHFFASYLHSIGVPSKNIMQMGGWATDNIMKSVYTHAYKSEKPITIPLYEQK